MIVIVCVMFFFDLSGPRSSPEGIVELFGGNLGVLGPSRRHLGRCLDEARSQHVADRVIDCITATSPALPMDRMLLAEYDANLMMQDWMPEASGKDNEVQLPVAPGITWPLKHSRAWPEVPDVLLQNVMQDLADNLWVRCLPLGNATCCYCRSA